jgi:hypothetical protein
MSVGVWMGVGLAKLRAFRRFLWLPSAENAYNFLLQLEHFWLILGSFPDFYHSTLL